MRGNSIPCWRFPPTNGGMEIARSAGAEQFAAMPLDSALRELIQNSIDHPLNNDKPVTFTLRSLDIPISLAHLTELRRHIDAAREHGLKQGDQKRVKRFQTMTRSLNGMTLPVLAAIDANTTGLRADGSKDTWRDLIHVEGSTADSQGVARGGSHGFGKNAPFNLSAIQTVFYTTRYRDHQGQDVHQCIGKAQLAAHHHPDGSNTLLQHTGFLACHDPTPNTPVSGDQIPDIFRLPEPGTAVYMLAHQLDDGWTRLATQAVARHFFHAIHSAKLVVRIEDRDGAHPVVVDRDTIADIMQRHLPDDPARHYLDALSSPQQQSKAESEQNHLRTVRYHILLQDGAPRRLAHVNSRGMLITHQHQHNPLSPGSNEVQQPWCIVAFPDGQDGSDEYARNFEPAAHDKIDLDRAPPGKRSQASNDFEQHRKQIRAKLREEAKITEVHRSENITEIPPSLADMAPENLDAGFHPNEQSTQQPNPDADAVPRPEDPPAPPAEPPRADEEQREESRSPTPRTDISARVYLNSDEQVTIHLVMPRTGENRVRISLNTAGEQNVEGNRRIPLLETVSLTPEARSVTLENGDAIIEAPDTNEVLILADIPPQTAIYHGYQITAS